MKRKRVIGIILTTMSILILSSCGKANQTKAADTNTIYFEDTGKRVSSGSREYIIVRDPTTDDLYLQNESGVGDLCPYYSKYSNYVQKGSELN